MAHEEYEIKQYSHEYVLPVVNLLQQYLWSGNLDDNVSYFKWKYHDNPYAEHPLGVVALYEGRVMGFRGYFPIRYEIAGRNSHITILCPGDTCVHTDHRRVGLSVIMGNRAIEEYSQDYRVMLNFTSTKKSLPGYQKLGFSQLGVKAFVTRCSIAGLMRYIVSYHEALPLSAGRVTFGTFDDIVVSESPKPQEMASLVAEQNGGESGKIRLLQDEAFFHWRYAHKRKKYIFYFLRTDDAISGYVVVGASPNNRRGYIIDYADGNGASLEHIVRRIIEMKHFDIISISMFCLSDAMSQSLRRLGFKTNSVVRKIEEILNGELPLLIRPVKQVYSESDFIIEGLDIRDIGNWSFKAICADDA